MTTLRWEKTGFGDSEWAYIGELVVGMIGSRDDGTVWYDATHAVNMKWTAKGYGEVRSVASAKRAVERAWSKWLVMAGLEPCRR